MSFTSCRSRCVGAALSVGLAAAVQAGPVRLDDMPPAAEHAEAKADTAATTAAAASGAAPSADPAGVGSRRVKVQSAEPGAVEKLKRREPGETPLSGPHQPQPQARPTPEDDGLATKAVAVAALAWINEVLPWGHARPAVGEHVSSTVTVPADGIDIAAELGVDGLGASTLRPERALAETNAAAAAREVNFSLPAGEGADRRRAAVLMDDNPVRQAIRFGRELVEHPLTWLVIVLIGIAHIAVARAGRGKK